MMEVMRREDLNTACGRCGHDVREHASWLVTAKCSHRDCKCRDFLFQPDVPRDDAT